MKIINVKHVVSILSPFFIPYNNGSLFVGFYLFAFADFLIIGDFSLLTLAPTGHTGTASASASSVPPADEAKPLDKAILSKLLATS